MPRIEEPIVPILLRQRHALAMHQEASSKSFSLILNVLYAALPSDSRRRQPAVKTFKEVRRLLEVRGALAHEA